MSSQWADQPYSLISTKAIPKDSIHGAYYAATQMASAHNGMIRGLNSIYLQATAIPQSDVNAIRDFLTYCQCWCENLHHHHDIEEEQFFPAIEELSHQPGLMQRNVEQHPAFVPGLDAFHKYVKTCSVSEFSGKELRQLVEDFAGPLVEHLRDEIGTLQLLDKYDSKRVREAYDECDRLGRKSDNQRIAPIVFGTADRTYEGGGIDFPAVPFFVPSLIHHVFERPHRGAWRFNPCTTWRDPQPLAFEPVSDGK